MSGLSGRLWGWVALVGSITAINYASRATGGSPDRNAVYQYATFVNGTVVYAVWLGLVLLIAYGRFDLLALRGVRRLGTAAGLAVAFLVGIFVVQAIVAALPLPQNPGNEQGLTPTGWQSAHAAAFALSLVLFAVFAPIVEELTFRGLGYSLLEPYGRVQAIAVTGVVFGIAHGLVEALLVLVPFGWGLAYIRSRTDSVYPGMVLHGLFNAAALVYSVAA